MVLSWEHDLVCSRGCHACPLRRTPFEFDAFPSPYFRIFFIPSRLLAIINLHHRPASQLELELRGSRDREGVG